MGGGDRLITSTAPTPATTMLPPSRPGTHQSLVCFTGGLTEVVCVAAGLGSGLVCPWEGKGKLTKLAASRARAGRQGTNIRVKIWKSIEQGGDRILIYGLECPRLTRELLERRQIVGVDADGS